MPTAIPFHFRFLRNRTKINAKHNINKKNHQNANCKIDSNAKCPKEAGSGPGQLHKQHGSKVNERDKSREIHK